MIGMKKIKEDLLVQKILFSDQSFKIMVQNRSSNVTSRSFHESLEMKFFYEGRGMQMIDSEIIIANPGDITITNPYEIHTNTETELYKGKYFLLIVDLDFFVDFNPKGIDLREILITKGLKFNNHIQGQERLQTIILRIVEELNDQKDHYRLIVYSLMSELISLLLRDEINQEKSKISHTDTDMRNSKIIAPALSKIFQDYDKTISIDELAALCNLSKYHFCRVFKEQMGVTAVQYIIRYRISLAETLLKEGVLKINEVAYACGFRDLSYFYRCYKKIKGISPSNIVH